MTDVRIDTEADPDGSGEVVRVAGELDLDTADQLARALDACQGDVVVDLAQCSFMDSSGLGALIRARNRLTTEGGTLSVREAAENVRRLFELTGLTDFLSG
jgi:anti-anti-sigma factor